MVQEVACRPGSFWKCSFVKRFQLLLRKYLTVVLVIILDSGDVETSASWWSVSLCSGVLLWSGSIPGSISCTSTTSAFLYFQPTIVGLDPGALGKGTIPSTKESHSFFLYSLTQRWHCLLRIAVLSLDSRSLSSGIICGELSSEYSSPSALIWSEKLSRRATTKLCEWPWTLVSQACEACRDVNARAIPHRDTAAYLAFLGSNEAAAHLPTPGLNCQPEPHPEAGTVCAQRQTVPASGRGFPRAKLPNCHSLAWVCPWAVISRWWHCWEYEWSIVEREHALIWFAPDSDSNSGYEQEISTYCPTHTTDFYTLILGPGYHTLTTIHQRCMCTHVHSALTYAFTHTHARTTLECWDCVQVSGHLNNLKCSASGLKVLSCYAVAMMFTMK